MSDQIAFIGRTNELQKIEKFIGKWDTCCVLCIHGEGGVGKTRLLEEISHLYRGKIGERLSVSNIIDFDDRALHVIENVERQIMQNLGAEALETYSRKLLDYQKMKLSDVSRDVLEEKQQEVSQTLIDKLNQRAVSRRVILLFDTLEKFESENALSRLLELIRHAQNTVFVLAGRNTKALYATLYHRLSDANVTTDLIELKPLDSQSRQEYLIQKQQQLHITLAPDLADKLLLMTRGKPILIDLAAEWLSRNVPLAWMREEGVEQTITEEELQQRQKEFEIQLVTHIGQIRTQMDRLVLLMSRVYPLNPEMVAQSLRLPVDEATALVKKAQTYVFVKSYADQQIYLHDEMRRMVRDYVWPDIDPEGDRRRLDSRFAVSYLVRGIETIDQDIKRLLSGEKEAQERKDTKAEFEAFLKRQGLEQELWAAREQLLFHTLFTDTAEGVKFFIKVFDQATRDYRYSFREVLLEQMDRYIEMAQQEAFLPPLSPSQIYEARIRRAKFWLDGGQYEKAEELLNALMVEIGLQPEQQIDIRIQLANVILRLGRIYESINLFEEAVNLSTEYKLQNWLIKAENGLGWAHRHTANHEEAQKHYTTALKIAKELGLKEDQALLYNNLGFLYAYIPHERQKALAFCSASLRLCEELEHDERDQKGAYSAPRGKGRAYSALGCVSFMDGQFNQALDYFQKALDIFEPVTDREWLSTVYSWRGAVYMSIDDLKQAEEDLQRSLQMNVKKDRPRNLSRLGLVHMMQGNLDEAQKRVNECRSLAMELNDVLYQLISIRDLANLAVHSQDYAQLQRLEGYLDDYLAKWGEPQDRRALGMLYLNLGSLALGQSNPDIAVDYYKLGLAPLVELGRYGNDTVEVYTQRLEKVFVTVLKGKSEVIKGIGSNLLSFWQNRGFDDLYPDVLLYFKKWSEGKGD